MLGRVKLCMLAGTSVSTTVGCWWCRWVCVSVGNLGGVWKIVVGSFGGFGIGSLYFSSLL